MITSCFPPARIKPLQLFALTLVAIFFAPSASAQNHHEDPPPFQVTSSTFTRGGTLPLSTIFNNIANGVNSCTANGAAGGDRSPELSWTNTPWGTQSFVVVLYDVTAAFTHWGMYNISGNAHGLPANAGVAGSAFGPQVENDFFAGKEYDGPCPPANVAPDAHKYVFTVYALGKKLKLPESANFPASSETLYHALIEAGREGNILASASIAGFYSATPQ